MVCTIQLLRLFPLTLMHRRYILMHMRTTLNIEAKLIEEAARLTGVTEKTALVRMGLAALIAREGARRLAEPACGTRRNRREILPLLASLPQAPLAGHDEVLGFLESGKLHGKGVGWIDIHLLASARIARSPIWTLDQRLARTAGSFSMGY